MKKITLSSFILASALLFSACNNSQKEDSKELAEEQNEQKFDDTNLEDDTEFAVAAAEGSMLEVKLGELAQTNGAAQSVKDFGKTMVADHSKANEELSALAKQKNITLPMSLSDEKQKDFDKLAEKKGKDFDKDYAAFMVDDHEKDVREFEKTAKDAKDPDIKAWAGGKVSTLQHHLEMAKTVKDGLK
ncbi:hypothetical protein DYBT9275_06113 [Dyadobacter sp. CECT 9275]|uniref:DUF4142 domain-containing protein n=1 Tax=Dyadobacter helix TaxID=2822344 RepID=A0A916NP64_9BACT|nr:DUF4142 domain-containing protein [Dyadobacter sp. CECT 9275]CAG5018971.1 hypothetical protein DYBT9275_06113 [Dyadobacter sp. CECT 9275]